MRAAIKVTLFGIMFFWVMGLLNVNILVFLGQGVVDRVALFSFYSKALFWVRYSCNHIVSLLL